MSAPEEVLGPYVIHERLGKGGMAVVHRAEHRGLAGFSKQVALKRLLPQVAADPNMVRLFIHEARLASHLRHANVAQTYDLGEVDETYFIAMEYVPGPTLTQLMRQCKAAAGQMPMPIILSILGQICEALDHAHNLCDDSGKPLGIIHRDVSPSNVLVSNDGIVKLIDFGIAKAADSGIVTQAGYIKGKFAYVAPEYLEGQLDARADLWGVGVIAYELMVGRPLFQAEDNFETLQQVKSMPIPLPSRSNREVNADIDNIVMTALTRDPDQRWQSAAAMRTAIAHAERDLGIVVGNAQMLEWVQWAFAQGPRTEGSEVAKVLVSLSEPSTATRELSPSQVEELDAIEPVRPPPAPPPPAPPPTPTVAAPAPATTPPERAPAPPAARPSAPPEPRTTERRAALPRPRRDLASVAPKRRLWLIVLALVLLLVAATAATYFLLPEPAGLAS